MIGSSTQQVEEVRGGLRRRPGGGGPQAAAVPGAGPGPDAFQLGPLLERPGAAVLGGQARGADGPGRLDVLAAFGEEVDLGVLPTGGVGMPCGAEAGDEVEQLGRGGAVDAARPGGEDAVHAARVALAAGTFQRTVSAGALADQRGGPVAPPGG